MSAIDGEPHLLIGEGFRSPTTLTCKIFAEPRALYLFKGGFLIIKVERRDGTVPDPADAKDEDKAKNDEVPSPREPSC